MRDRDFALAILFLGSLVIAIFVFFFARWKKGQSLSMSVFFAGNAMGATLCAFTLIAFDTFLQPPRGMGVERIAYPFLFLFISFIITVILSLVLFIFTSNKKNLKKFTLTAEAEDILDQASKEDN
jgi:ABC-type Na+ efflux pump permease subunit